jgi:hypothetical protein
MGGSVSNIIFPPACCYLPNQAPWSSHTGHRAQGLTHGGFHPNPLPFLSHSFRLDKQGVPDTLRKQTGVGANEVITTPKADRFQELCSWRELQDLQDLQDL